MSPAMLPAVPDYAVLDGLRLDVPSQVWQVRRTDRKSVRQLADGHRAQQLAYTGAGGPMVAAVRTMTLRWRHLGPLRHRVQRLLANPGPHSLVLWRREHLAYAGDGSREEFRLPWPSALDSHSPQDVDAAGLAAMAPAVYLDPLGDPLPTVVVPSAFYDAGAPIPGEAWVREGGRDLRLGTAPAPGEVFHVDLVPVYPVIQAPDTEASYQDPTSEPLDLVLLEA